MILRSRRVVPLLFLPAALSHAADPRPVALPASDGRLISADYHAPKRTGGAPAAMAILLHGYMSDRGDWRPLAGPLAEAGVGALALDLRGHGQSADDSARNRVRDRDPLIFEEMVRDVRAAYDWLATQSELDRSRFAVLGIEFGASLALRYAALDRSVDVIVCLQPGTESMGLDSRSDAAKIKGRGLLFVARDDPRERRGTDALAELIPAEKLLLRAADPSTGLLDADPAAVRRIVDFVRRNVGPPSDRLVFGTINSPIYHERGSRWIDRISATNLRYYSSAAEAEARGVRRSFTTGPRADARDESREQSRNATRSPARP